MDSATHVRSLLVSLVGLVVSVAALGIEPNVQECAKFQNPVLAAKTCP